jgi:hypothetical protein
MSVERSGPAVCNVSFNREGKDEMIKASNDSERVNDFETVLFGI